MEDEIYTFSEDDLKIYEVKQGTPEWHNARLGRISASRLCDVTDYTRNGAPSAKRTAYKKQLVAERLIGVAGMPNTYITNEMMWGQQNEEIARTTYILRTGNKVTAEGFVYNKKLKAGSSVDGLVNHDGNLEIKSPASHNFLYNIVKPGALNFEEGNDALPPQYKQQVQGQMLITGRNWCDFVGSDSRFPTGLDLFITRVYKEDDYCDWLAEEIKAFEKEVAADVRFFSNFLPVCEFVCQICGLMFTDNLNVCPNCKTPGCRTEKVLKPADKKLSDLFNGVNIKE